MKSLASAFILALLFITKASAVQAAETDSQDHILAGLWQAYYTAEKADKPQDQLTALKAIKKEARSRRLAWDFYDAAQRTARVRASVNWKDRKEADNDFTREVEEFGEPAAVFYLRSRRTDAASLFEYARANRDRLQQTANIAFHKSDRTVNSRLYSPALLSTFANDWDYALWHCYLASDGSDSTMLLDGSLGGTVLEYPWNAFTDYDITDDASGKLERENAADGSAGAKVLWEDYRSCYQGKAAELMGWQNLLRIRMRSARQEADFKTLLDECKAFEKLRASYSRGTEHEIADACAYAEALIGTLNAKAISLEIEDGKILIMFTNLPSGELKITRDKNTVWQTAVTNSGCRFFVPDSVWVDLPVLDDGEYNIVCSNGKIEDSRPYSSHTLSIATREDSRGFGVYVTDYETGEPLKKCDFTLFDRSGEKIAEAKDVPLNGFTPLPDDLSSRLDPKVWGYDLVASTGVSPKRMSTRHIVRHESDSSLPGKDDDRYYCEVLTDRTAFNPGETVHFKVIAWQGKYDMKAVSARTTLTAIIRDQENMEIARKELVTNEFGSAAGEFELIRTERGGMFIISIEKNNQPLGEARICVEDFVPPTFTVELDKDDRIYVPGDTLECHGKVGAYSGHELSAATVHYQLSHSWEYLYDGEVVPDSHGRFIVRCPIPPDKSGHYALDITVNDITGETLEFRHDFQVSDYLNLNVSLTGGAKGKVSIPGINRWNTEPGIISGDVAEFDVKTGKTGATAPGLKVNWTFTRGAEVILQGELGGSGSVKIPVTGLPSGLYEFKAAAVLKGPDGREYTAEAEKTVLKMSGNDTALYDDVTAVIRDVEEDPLSLQIGATGGRAWFVIELFRDGNKLLESKLISIAGEKGKSGSLQRVRFERRSDWPDSLKLKVLLFRKGDAITWERNIEPESKDDVTTLPLSFTRFLDTTLPDTDYTFEITSVPEIECAAAMFDKGLENIWWCFWFPLQHPARPVPPVSYNTSCGSVGAALYHSMHRAFRTSSTKSVNGTAVEEVMMDCAATGYADTDEDVKEEALPFALVEKMRITPVRENFAKTIAWEPFLRSDSDGRIKLRFRTADKLSTYIVHLFAHDRNMNSAVLRREMVVTLPVQVAVVQPGYLYEGDRYVVHASLSNSSETAVSGNMTAEFFDGDSYKDAVPVCTDVREVTVPRGGAAECTFEAPAGLTSGTLGILLRFIPDDGAGADAVFVTVPLKKAVQTITESHSGLLKDGESRTDLEARLRSQFVNVPGSGAKGTVISIHRMLMDAVPRNIQPKSDNILALLDAVYSNILVRRLGAPGVPDAELKQMEEKITACRNTDGGYAWFSGMNSSPSVTAAALERLHRMAAAGYTVPDRMRTTDAALFLDKAYFDESARPVWCGGISMEQYLYVRALYPVAFESPDINPKSWSKHKKEIKEYLVPSDRRGLNGQILPKARRLATLSALLASSAGTELAAGWGITLPSGMSRSVTADVESLLQYSVEHWAGGCYYPNAVMPFRGLLESELYAHTLLAGLLEAYGHSGTADGIRLWMMIQKETQHWESDPAYVEALGCVLEGSVEMLRTSVLALSATSANPISSISASGNDFAVSRRWYVRRNSGSDPDSDGGAAQFIELRDGDVLHTGDKVRAEYSIWNRENRSFVRLTAPRHAALRPVEQLSGHIGWRLNPLRISGRYDVSPQGYRSVLTDRTEYWFDSYPEDNTTLTEDFFVTQEGIFQTPVVTIESLYAPHYRANSSSESPLVVR